MPAILIILIVWLWAIGDCSKNYSEPESKAIKHARKYDEGKALEEQRVVYNAWVKLHPNTLTFEEWLALRKANLITP